MQFVQAPCYATMDKLSDFNDIFNRRKNVFHLSEFSAESENPIDKKGGIQWKATA